MIFIPKYNLQRILTQVYVELMVTMGDRQIDGSSEIVLDQDGGSTEGQSLWIRCLREVGIFRCEEYCYRFGVEDPGS